MTDRLHSVVPVAADRLLTCEEVGALLVLKKSAIYQQAQDGKLPKPCRRGRWRLSDIQRHIEGLGA